MGGKLWDKEKGLLNCQLSFYRRRNVHKPRLQRSLQKVLQDDLLKKEIGALLYCYEPTVANMQGDAWRKVKRSRAWLESAATFTQQASAEVKMRVETVVPSMTVEIIILILYLCTCGGVKYWAHRQIEPVLDAALDCHHGTLKVTLRSTNMT
jgi:hypothetical protein